MGSTPKAISGRWVLCDSIPMLFGVIRIARLCVRYSQWHLSIDRALKRWHLLIAFQKAAIDRHCQIGESHNCKLQCISRHVIVHANFKIQFWSSAGHSLDCILYSAAQLVAFWFLHKTITRANLVTSQMASQLPVYATSICCQCTSLVYSIQRGSSSLNRSD